VYVTWKSTSHTGLDRGSVGELVEVGALDIEVTEAVMTGAEVEIEVTPATEELKGATLTDELPAAMLEELTTGATEVLTGATEVLWTTEMEVLE